MISLTAEYSLVAVAYLAEHPARAMTTRQIADATKVPASYLAKILHTLARAGIVESRRGINGGFALARPPQDITLWDVIRVCDETGRRSGCPLGIEAQDSSPCRLRRHLAEAAAQLEEILGSVTVARLSQADASEPPTRTAPADGL